MKDVFSLTSAVVLLIVVIGIGPILTIASLNTVFGLSIAYNFYTWLSVVWLGFILSRARVKSK